MHCLYHQEYCHSFRAIYLIEDFLSTFVIPKIMLSTIKRVKEKTHKVGKL